MKKILLTSAFVALSAGTAAAQITLGGSARFGGLYMGSGTAIAATGSAADITAAQGVVTAADTTAAADATAAAAAATAYQAAPNAGNLAALQTANATAAASAGSAATAAAQLDAIDGTAAAMSSFVLTNRFTLNIDGVAETDNGDTFFARVRIRGGNTGEGATSASSVSAPRVGVTVSGFTVATGNILGALESMPNLYGGAVGLTGLGWGNVVTNYAPAGSFAWDSFSSGGGGANGVEVIYSANGFSGSISYSPTGADRTAGYLAYTFGDWTAAIAAQSSTAAGEDMTVLTLAGNIGDFSVGAAYASLEGNNDTGRISGSYTFGGGTTIVGYVVGTDTAGLDTAYGLGFTQSLGGATLAGGVVQDATGRTRADLGVRFSF